MSNFFPKAAVGGGIENRVYMAARDSRGRPLEIRANIVDAKGTSVASVETGRKAAVFWRSSPDAAQTYRLQISIPPGVADSPLLPPASSDQPVAVSVRQGVIDPGDPLELNLRATKDRLPLVVAARVRGMLVGQQLLVTSADMRANPKSLSLPLDDRVAGLIRLTVYEDSASPAKVLAQRWVYRQPRLLSVRAAQRQDGRRRVVAFDPERERAARRRGPLCDGCGKPGAVARSLARLSRRRRTGESSRLGGCGLKFVRRHRRRKELGSHARLPAATRKWKGNGGRRESGCRSNALSRALRQPRRIAGTIRRRHERVPCQTNSRRQCAESCSDFLAGWPWVCW